MGKAGRREWQSVTFTTTPPNCILQQPTYKVERDLSPYLLRQGIEGKYLPAEVECWCISCREKTVTSDGRNTFVDMKPTWTIGCSLYVKSTKVCYRCRTQANGKRKDYAVRFILKTDDVLSITLNSLRDFHDRYSHLGRVAHDVLLNEQRASSKESRKRKREEDD